MNGTGAGESSSYAEMRTRNLLCPGHRWTGSPLSIDAMLFSVGVVDNGTRDGRRRLAFATSDFQIGTITTWMLPFEESDTLYGFHSTDILLQDAWTNMKIKLKILLTFTSAILELLQIKNNRS